MAKKQPMYGSEASTDNDAIADVATTAATNSSPYGFSEVQANALVSSVNSIIAALEKFGILKT